MKFISWQTLFSLTLLYLLIKAYKFNRYLKKYLVPYQIQITEDEIRNGAQQLTFVVRFGKGYFRRKYFTTIGQMENPNPLNFADLKRMLTLTLIETFNQGYGKSEQEYFYIQSANPNGTSDYKVKFLTVKDEVINNLQAAVNK